MKQHQQRLNRRNHPTIGASNSARNQSIQDSRSYSAGRKSSDDGVGVQYTADSSRRIPVNRQGQSFARQAVSRLFSTWRARSLVDWGLALLPSGVGFAVGMYLTPNWTVPRVLGSIVDQVWLVLDPGSHAAFMMVTASGLVLGEGCASIVTAVVHAAMA